MNIPEYDFNTRNPFLARVYLCHLNLGHEKRSQLKELNSLFLGKYSNTTSLGSIPSNHNTMKIVIINTYIHKSSQWGHRLFKIQMSSWNDLWRPKKWLGMGGPPWCIDRL